MCFKSQVGPRYAYPELDMCYEHTCLDAKKAQLWMYLLINTISEWPPNLFKHVWMDGLDSLIAQPGPQWSIT